MVIFASNYLPLVEKTKARHFSNEVAYFLSDLWKHNSLGVPQTM